MMREQTVTKKKEGFRGQKAIIIPRRILSTQCEKNGMIAPLYVTDIGYYPKAKFHYRERLHGADQHILIYCSEGKGSIKVHKAEYNMNAGDFLLIPIQTAHQYASDEENPWTIYWMHFKGTISNEIVNLALTKLGGHRGFVSYSEERNRLFNNMYNTMERGYKSDNLVHVSMSLWYYLTTFIFADKLSISREPSGGHLIDKAIDFMSKKTEQIVSLGEIANAVNLSSSHFSSFFKKKTGFTPIEYFNHLKVQKACQYLLFSDLRVKEIAYKLGINDPYYFSRLFGKVMGVSPNEYRARSNIASKRNVL
jgi:AraC-like DNA-binding protein